MLTDAIKILYEMIQNADDAPLDIGEYLRRVDSERRYGALPLTEKSEKIHLDLLHKINAITPHPIERKVMFKHKPDTAGCLVKLDDGLHHILLDYKVANLIMPEDEFYAPDSVNCQHITPEDYLRQVIAHEYGHIFYSDYLDCLVHGPEENPLDNLEIDEAFAFWFGDFMSGVKSPLSDLVRNYKIQIGLNFDTVIKIYDGLTKLVNEFGVESAFNASKLSEIFKRFHRKSPINPTTEDEDSQTT